MQVQVTDPLALAEETRHEYGIDLVAGDKLSPADAVILAVSHDQYKSGGWKLVSNLLKGGRGIVLDVKSLLDRAQMPDGIQLWRL